LFFEWVIPVPSTAFIAVEKQERRRHMEQDIRERIALERYRIISPVLAEPARAQN